MPFYKRRLPHVQPEDGVFALTVSLKGSLPKHVIRQLQDERDYLINKAMKEGKSDEDIKALIKKAKQLYFGKYDDLLDNPTSGPVWLGQKNIAQVAMDSLHYLDGLDYKLVCYCIMSNHFHLVIYKCKRQLFSIMQTFKSFTGIETNDIIYGRKKKGDKRPKFWQKESYDHSIEDRGDFVNQINYAVKNPVKAGIITDWRDWEFTYIREEFRKYIV